MIYGNIPYRLPQMYLLEDEVDIQPRCAIIYSLYLMPSLTAPVD